MLKKGVLFVSNGHGEDIIGASLAKELLSKRNDIDIYVLPMVGRGKAYENIGPAEIIGPRREMPSGGFIRRNMRALIKDIRSGLLTLSIDQLRALRKIRDRIDLVISVGDIIAVLLPGYALKKPLVFVAVAKTDYYTGEKPGYYKIEQKVMQKYCTLICPRDIKTTKTLERLGLPAKYLGNPMMDSFTVKGLGFDILDEQKVIGILPGSRDEAFDNLKLILPATEFIAKGIANAAFLVGLAPSLVPERLETLANAIGWRFINHLDLLEQGIHGCFVSPGGVKVNINRGDFGDVLVKADIFIGMAGTGNEQAVGMGKPVVTCVGNGPQFTPDFVRKQKLLLGDSISVVEQDAKKLADEVVRIFNTRDLYDYMASIGHQRMGNAGAIAKIASEAMFALQSK